MRTEQHRAEIDRLERRLLRLLRIERLARDHRVSTSLEDVTAVSKEVEGAMRDWREAVAE